MEESLNELARLVDTAGGIVEKKVWQDISRPNPTTFIGSGKAEEIGELLKDSDIKLVVFDEELSAAQNRNLEKIWGVKVVDRTAVILDIFAKRARTKAACLQVELAQLEYIKPRLVGMWDHFNKQVGGIGVRGPGETQLEVDRRGIKDRVVFLKKQLEKVSSHRDIHHIRREKIPIPIISLVGYTNSGKSTLMNTLTNAGVLVEDKLFATLDTTVRKLRLKSGREVLIADTVGFIKKLPHQLVESFRATFDEIQCSQMLLHIVDASSESSKENFNVVRNVLEEVNLKDKPMLTVWNKSDLLEHTHPSDEHNVYISALKKDGIEALINKIEEILRKNFTRVKLLLPHTAGDILSNLYKISHIWSVEHQDNGVLVDVELYQKYAGKYKQYIV